MKISHFFLLFIIFASGCKKDKNENCDIVKTIISNNGTSSYIVLYEYDEKRRMKRISESPGVTTDFQYFPDSVVAQQSSARTVYYLNTSGYADSSKLRFSVNPNQLSFDSRYTYNAEGFLT